METIDFLLGGIFILTGFFSLLSSILNFEWFFNHRKTDTIVRWFGRNGARVFYAILGLSLIVCGILAMFYWEEAQQSLH